MPNEKASDGRLTEDEWIGRWFGPLRDAGVSQKVLCSVFKRDHRTLKALSSKQDGEGD